MTFAHMFIGAARALDIPARYVTGYLAADEDHPAAFHAWGEAYDDGLGWIGFDAALGICPTDRHVRLAAGLDARSTMPVRVAPELEAPRELAVSVEVLAEAAQ
jgi:transglutaminase-like putative cysteine protease